MTGKQVMKEYLLDNADHRFDMYKIQNDLPKFAERFGVYHTPESWTRYFRFVREELGLVEVEGERWKTWAFQEQLSLL